MIQRVIGFSARHKAGVLLSALAAVLGSAWSLPYLSLDALPDLSDPQVIVISTWHKSPDMIESELTAPLARAMMKVPGVKQVRGLSDANLSFVYVLLEDGVDIANARRDVSQALQEKRSALPPDAHIDIGPNGSGVGWIYQYALRDVGGTHRLQDLRDLQESVVRPRLERIRGVAEVATVGGLQKEFHIEVDPQALQSHGFSLSHVVAAIQQNNRSFSPGMMDLHGQEVMLRGKGALSRLSDIESVRLGTVNPRDSGSGAHSSAPPVPRSAAAVLIKQIAHVREGVAPRRGVADLDGEGEVVGGIVVMRQQENALNVISQVKAELKDLQQALPAGVELIPTYDRSGLIEQAIHTLTREIGWQMAVVSLVILVFLRHLPSAIVPIVTLPLSVLLVFPLLLWAGVTVNIMSLAGIMISIGVLVDGAIIEVENAYQRMAPHTKANPEADLSAVRLKAIQEVGPSVFYSLLVVGVAFLPIFALTDQEGRLFKPLAFSKTFTMGIAALLAITVDPAMRMMFTRTRPFQGGSPLVNRVLQALCIGTYRTDERASWMSRLQRGYEVMSRWSLRHPRKTFGAMGLVMALSIPMAFRLGTEFMPPLDEGSLLFMPVTAPGITLGEAAALLQRQDAVIKLCPEVARVFGKVGRAETATDPAPLSMIETTILLKPKSEWRRGQTTAGILEELDRSLQWPGVQKAWTMPIKGRIEMLSTGLRTPLGLKIYGHDLAAMERVGGQVEQALQTLGHTRQVLVERNAEEPYLDFDVDRGALAQYGLSVDDVDMALNTALGGMVSSTVMEEGLARPVRIRYPVTARSTLSDLQRIVVRTPAGGSVPVQDLARIRMESGPAMLRHENGSLCTYVFVDVQGTDIPSYVRQAKGVIRDQVVVPPGITLQWSGQYEHLERTWDTLQWLIPLTVALIGLLMYMNTGSGAQTAMILITLPFSLIGAVWFMGLSGYPLSLAVGVGAIALLGLDAETGIFMLMYLNIAYRELTDRHPTPSRGEVEEAVMAGAVKRLRPKVMTGAAIVCSLIPLYLSADIGADMLKRIGAPLAGGVITSVLFELIMYPLLFYVWKTKGLREE